MLKKSCAVVVVVVAASLSLAAPAQASHGESHKQAFCVPGQFLKTFAQLPGESAPETVEVAPGELVTTFCAPGQLD